MNPVIDQQQAVISDDADRGTRLLLTGSAVLAAALGLWVVYVKIHPASWTLYPVDLRVYRDGGLIAMHVRPTYDAALRYPLYDWSDGVNLRFTYPPFAALVFTVVSPVPWPLLPRLSQVGNVAALAIAAWFTMAGLGYAGRADRRVRIGGAMLGTAAGLATEPVFRTMYLGQVNIILMAMVIWDLARPGRRRWQGAMTGLAAGVKLTPLIFIPYLLLTRRFRQAAVACASFAATIALGFLVMPGDSADWWLHGLFLNDSRAGFPSWGGNQSLYALAARLAGSLHAATVWWLLAALAVTAAGLLAAAAWHQAGHSMLGILLTALVGLLDSPISWDHHWVWVVPGMMTAAHYAARARRPRTILGGRGLAGGRGLLGSMAFPGGRALGCLAVTVGMLAVYFPWPGSLWSYKNTGPGNFTNGLLWAAPNSPVKLFAADGDRPWYREYHWHGLQHLAGNAYVLTGLALFALLTIMAAHRRSASGLMTSALAWSAPASASPAASEDLAGLGCRPEGWRPEGGRPARLAGRAVTRSSAIGRSVASASNASAFMATRRGSVSPGR